MRDSGTLYYTGYAKFFNDGTTECDKVSWSSWLFMSNFLS